MNSDVCIITEGTYPYVIGGVSTWIAQLIESMPDLSFSVVNISASREIPRELRYTLPENLVEICDVFVFDSDSSELSDQDIPFVNLAIQREKKDPATAYSLNREKDALLGLYRAISTGQKIKLNAIQVLAEKAESDKDFIAAIMQSYSAWKVVRQLYREIAIPGLSFLDYYWNLRAQQLPILNVLRTSMPKARVYHAACTGYAGLLGAYAAYESGRPLILTEHGIYSLERCIELTKLDWLPSFSTSRFLQLKRSRNWFRESWIEFFQSLSRTAYDNAAKIISLYQGNGDIQISEGAQREKIEIIPNGINTDTFRNIPIRRKALGETLRVGFIGRVVGIKDIKSLLRAMSILSVWDVPFQTTIVGPLDEEPEYVTECLELLEALNLQDKVFFAGPRRDLKSTYAEMDVLVLTSVSEGFPYVILEANCAGLPVVATDVGACREILTGANESNMKIGPSGRITKVGNPEETASELAYLAQHPDISYIYGQRGRERVLRHYDLKNIMRKYRDIYVTYLSAARKSRPDSTAKNVRTLLQGVN